jgi:hypothetical protein
VDEVVAGKSAGTTPAPDVGAAVAAVPPAVAATPPVRTIIEELISSYVYLRRCIGIIGLALPFALVFGHDIAIRQFEFRDSMSSYYYTDMRNVFVGSLCAIGVFLFSYRYEWIDNILTNVAGVLAIGVALCPTTNAHPSSAGKIVDYLHFTFASILFLLLASFCFVIFTRTDPTQPATRRKSQRNMLYRVCGIVIVVCVAFAGLSQTPLFSDSFRVHGNPLLWTESLAVFAFGLSWLVKGKTFLQD